MQEIVNFDEFTAHLTTDEQQQLLKYLPYIDTFAPPDRFVYSPSCPFGITDWLTTMEQWAKLRERGVNT